MSVAEAASAGHAAMAKIEDAQTTMRGAYEQLQEAIGLVNAMFGDNFESGARTEIIGVIGDTDSPDTAMGMLTDAGQNCEQAKDLIEAYIARMAQ